MPRKKRDGAVAVAETSTQPMGKRPEYIDGPPVDPSGQLVQSRATESQSELNDGASEGRHWGNPYKAIVTTPDFEMGENRRFKQRVFLFKEKPTDEVLAQLKEAGFSYRANEKAWTIEATPANRLLSDDLAQHFGGQSAGKSRE